MSFCWGVRGLGFGFGVVVLLGGVVFGVLGGGELFVWGVF